MATFSKENFFILESLLQAQKFSRVLDLDAYLATTDFHTPTKNFTVVVDCVAQNLFPIMENVYGKIYRSRDEYKFHRFDAVILSRERSTEEFLDALIEIDSLAENIFAFVRKNSPLEKFLTAHKKNFEALEFFEASGGFWCHIKNFARNDFKIFVVTHKQVNFSPLPEIYEIIHAGRARAKKFFCDLGDDSGENISRLNPFLDELTVLFWIWKNTRQEFVGLCHYRRFFTADETQKTFDAKKILDAAQIEKIFRDCDIITPIEGVTKISQREIIFLGTGQPDLNRLVEKIFRQHILLKQPEYLDAFEKILDSIAFFPCGMFIARRKIFDAYCSWLFSFLIDVTEEVRDKIRVGEKTLEDLGHDYSRVVGFFAERLLTVWLMKNFLRIKELPVMYREDV